MVFLFATNKESHFQYMLDRKIFDRDLFHNFLDHTYQHFLTLTCTGSSCLMICVDKAYYDVKISGVEIKPYPVKRGKSATFSIAASTGNYFVLFYLCRIIVQL